jgi:formylmethanofuran dehydrogenase subunit C
VLNKQELDENREIIAPKKVPKLFEGKKIEEIKKMKELKQTGIKVNLGNGKFAYTVNPDDPNAEKIIIDEEDE